MSSPMSLSRFDEIYEAVFKAGTSLIEKAEQEIKRLQNVYAPMLRVLSYVNKWRERESVCVCVCVCCLWKLKCERLLSLEVNKKEYEFLEDKSIYRQSLSCSRLQMHGTKSKMRT